MYQRYAKGRQLDHCGGKKIINDFCVIEKIAQTLRLITPAAPAALISKWKLRYAWVFDRFFQFKDTENQTRVALAVTQHYAKSR